MPIIESTDISLVLSGGTGNSNPNLSLGGDPSVYTISTSINNLFSDVTSDQATTGSTDYRCIYIFNNSETSVFYNVTVTLSSQVTGGAVVNIGVLERDERQKITINGNPTGGTIKLQYESSVTGDITWDNNPAIFAQNLETAINVLSELTEVSVIQGGVSSEFLVDFIGIDGNRNHNLLLLNTNSLTPAVSDPIVTVVIEGGPRNDIADNIGVATITPSGVVFTDGTVTIGDVLPEEGFPIWFRRVIDAATEAIDSDGCTIKITGNAFP